MLINKSAPKFVTSRLKDAVIMISNSSECSSPALEKYTSTEVFMIVLATAFTRLVSPVLGCYKFIVSLLTVASNILVIMAFVMNRQLRTINNYLIINLAFADLTVGLISMNFYTAYIGLSFSFLA